jgi:orotate phosphoribosyltransferase
MQDKLEFIRFMLACGALKFGDFTTKSGRKSPYFINTGCFSTGSSLSRLGKAYAELIQQSGVPFDALFGPAYKGIPLAAAASIGLFESFGLDKPWFFNRKEAKDHGEGGGFVGSVPEKGQKVIFIDDVITAGTALRETLPAIRAQTGAVIEHMFIAVNRGERATEAASVSAVQAVEEECGVQVHAIITVRDIYSFLTRSSDPAFAPHLFAMKRYMDKWVI